MSDALNAAGAPNSQDSTIKPRILQGEYFRYNADLPRGSHLSAGAAELALDAQIRDIEQASGKAWGESKKLVAAAMEVRIHAAGKFEPEVIKKLSFDLARHQMTQGGDFDQNTHPFFETYRALVAQVPALRERVQDMRAARVGEPELEGMRQLDAHDRPQAETPAFRDWFGESKVVNAAGQPLIVFHGSGVEIDSFKTSFDTYNEPKNQNWAGQIGAWFAGPSEWADYEIGYAEATAEVFSDLSARKTEGTGAVIYPVFLAIGNPAEMEGHDDFMEQMQEAGGVAAFRRELEEKGHDGLVIRGCYSDGDMVRDDWVAFHPVQIKSAIGNTGAFCKNNPDLCDRKSMDLKVQNRASQAAAFVHNLGTRAAITP